MPGHTRGAVAVPGCHDAGRCCTTDSGKPGESPSRTPVDPVRSCAVCEGAWKLEPPIALVMPLPDERLMDELACPARLGRASVGAFDVVDGRGPPGA